MALGLLSGALNLGAALLKGNKKSGKKVASAITKREPKKDAIVKKEVKVSVKTVSKEKLLNIKPPEQPKQSTQSSGVSSIDSVLDKIDNTLFNLINVAGDSAKLQQNKLKRERIKAGRQKKKRREDMLENTQKAIASLGAKVPKPVKSIWDKLKTFFGNVLIGSLVLFILKNWDAIVKTIQNMVDKIKELLVKLEPILIPVWNFAKWMVVKSVELTAGLVGVEDADKNTLLKNLGEITKKGLELFGVFKGVEKFVNDIRGGKEPDAAKEIPALTGKDDSRIKDAKELKNQGAGAEIVEKMFPKSEQSEAQKGSDAVNKFFGHEVDGDQSSLGGGEALKKKNDEGKKKVLKITGITAKGYLVGTGDDQREIIPKGERRKEHHAKLWARHSGGTETRDASGQMKSQQILEYAGKKYHPDHPQYEMVKEAITAAMSGDKKTYADLDWKLMTTPNKQDLSTGLNTQLPYEKSQGTTNIFITKKVGTSAPVNGGSGSTLLPIPMLNSGVEMTQNLAQYELTTV